MKVAILYDESEKLHTTNWSLTWREFCEENDIEYSIANPYNIGIVNHLLRFDIILWHFSGYSYKDMLMAKNVMFTLEMHGKKIFPSFKDAWHFDDKLAEAYLLESINAPIPKSFYYYDIKNLEIGIEEKILPFPIVAKLRNGSGSHNVRMINTKEELLVYAKKILTSGINSAPSLIYKASSNLKSTDNLKTFINRAKRIPEFLTSLSNAKKFNVEKGYVFLQEFIPNEGYDLKIVVVGDKLSFIGRKIRKGDFRASGGGDLFYDKSYVTKDIIDSAFKTSDKLDFKCMGYDYVVNKVTGKGKIVEISYGFSHEALLAANGHFDRAGKWYDEPLNVPYEIIKRMIG